MLAPRAASILNTRPGSGKQGTVNMSFSTTIKEIPLGPYTLRLLMQDQIPLVEWENNFFNHVWLLSQHLSPLSDPAYLKEFAEISNFLWKGLQFQFIDQIAHYQKFYIEQVELEKKYSSDVFPYRLTDYKLFDVSVMHAPRLENGHLFYFVYNTTTGLPYRVVCPFPYTSTSTLVHYQILPIKTEASRS
jgi:hypothetical protein